MKLAFSELPRKNYGSYDNAMRAVEAVHKGPGNNDLPNDIRFVIATLPDGRRGVRFFPVFLPREDQVQLGIYLAHQGFCMVRW